LKPEFLAACFFLPREKIAAIVPLGEGNINDTYTVTLRSGERRILQRINPAVFPDPEAVMHNMRMILDHINRDEHKKSLSEQGITLPILYPGKTGLWYKEQDGSVWRMMSMVIGAVTLNRVSHPAQSEQLGRCLGLFHRLVSGLSPGSLNPTLPDIHNTRKYFRNFNNIVSRHERAATTESAYCEEFIAQRRNLAGILVEEGKDLTSSVIHGDPKVDNFLFDLAGEKVISLIDLDTIQRGLLLHDIGDALRSCCNCSGENNSGTGKIFFAPRLFHAWLTGYFSQPGMVLTPDDLQHIVVSVQLITFELGLRFYTDYLEGNRYFKVRHPGQNIQRAMVQFDLTVSIEEQWDRLQDLTQKAVASPQNHN